MMKKIVLSLTLSIAATMVTATAHNETAAPATPEAAASQQHTCTAATCDVPARDIIDDAIAGAPLNTDQRKWALTHRHAIAVGLVLLALHILGERKNNSGFFSWPLNTIPAGCGVICDANQRIWDYAKEHAGAATLISITAFFLHDLLLRGDKSYLKLLLGKPVVQGLLNDLDGNPQIADQKATPATTDTSGPSCTRGVCCAC